MANTNAQGKVPNVSQHGYSSFRTDLFGRIKTSEPYTLFDSSHRYQRNNDFSDETVGGGSVTYLANESSLSLSVGTASGDKVTMESRKVFPYQPGKSLQVMQTFVMSQAKANLKQRVGYFSRQNGFFLEQDGLNTYLVIRSSASGNIIEDRVAQANWNIDQLNGDGPSNYRLDLSKGQILWSEFEWLGLGSVRVGFVVDGYFVPVHQFNHANVVTSVYMTTASLPIRYEIENTGITASSSAMKQVCATVISNGGYFKPTESYTAIRQSGSVGTSFYPLIALRMVEGRTDSVIIPDAINISPTSAGDFEFALIKNPSVLTGGSWTTHSPKNNVEFNTTATAMTGGDILLQGFFSTTNQTSESATVVDDKNFAFQLGRTNSSTPVSDIFVLACRISAGTSAVKSSLAWYDLL
jgi:hypothetical protein